MASLDHTREFATQVVQELQAAGHVALWAGGCVRDLLMSREPQDYDVATDARPDEVRRMFGQRRTLAVGESFGVIIVLGPRLDGDQIKVEVATFRAEGHYPDGRRPDPAQIRYTTAEEDARRRDFTINGMFFDPIAGQVLDFVGGEADVRSGIVRAIGRPQDRMQEDKLRMLRAVRFAATLDFELDGETAAAVRELAPQLAVVSVERITQELQKMLVSRHRRRAMRLVQQLGLLSVILPELDDVANVEETGPWAHVLDMLDQLASPRFELALGVLLQHLRPHGGESKRDRDRSGTVAGIARRLRLSNLQADRVVWLVAHQRELEHAAALPIARLKRALAHEYADDLLQWMRADCAARGSSTDVLDFIDQFLAETPRDELNPPPLITGTDLIGLGLPPGPDFQQRLEQVRDAQLEGRIATRDAALEMVRRGMASQR
jgi:poly(A) polymerase